MAHEEKTASAVATPIRTDSAASDTEDYRELPFRLVELLVQAQPVAESLFSDFDFGESVPGMHAHGR